MSIIQNTKKIKITLKVFYENAKTLIMKKARELKPDQKDLWLNGLYRVYYNLDMGLSTHKVKHLQRTGDV